MKTNTLNYVNEATPSLYKSVEDEVYFNDAEKPMGLLGGVAFVFGSIIGTGVFISVNDTFNVLSSNNIWMVVILWLSGGIISLIGSLCYGELGCRFPQTGGESIYYKELLGRKFSVLFVIVYVFVVKTITLAAISLTGSKYLVNTFNLFDTGKTDLVVKITSITLLILSFLVNCFNRKVITRCLYVFSLIKLSAIFLVISFGIYSLARGQTEDWKPPYVFEGFDFLRLSAAFVSVCWSFEGWNSIGLKAGDIRNPKRNIVLSGVIGVSLVTAAYVFCVISYSTVLGFDSVRSSETVALAFAIQMMKKFFPVVSIMIFCSAFGSTIGCLYTLGGVMTYAGKEHLVSPVFSLVHRRSRIPYFSLALITMVSCCLVFLRFQDLLNYCSFVTWAFYFLSFQCLWIVKLRKSSSTSTPGFSVNYFFIILMQLVCVYMVFMCFFNYFFGCLFIATLMAFIYFIQFVKFDASKCRVVTKVIDSFENNLSSLFNLEQAKEEDVQ